MSSGRIKTAASFRRLVVGLKAILSCLPVIVFAVLLGPPAEKLCQNCFEAVLQAFEKMRLILSVSETYPIYANMLCKPPF